MKNAFVNKHTKKNKHKFNSGKKQKQNLTKKPMEIEFEAKFLNVNKKELIERLKNIGAKMVSPNTIYKRCMYGLCDIKRGYVRVRDEGNKTTLTAKIYKDSQFPEEYEVTIKDDFESGKAFLGALNLTEKSYHETMREKWSLSLGKSKKGRSRGNGNGNSNCNECEIAFDSIPGIPLYVEIECKSKQNLNKAIKMLNLDSKNNNGDKYKKYFGSYGKCFVEYYGMSENDINNLIPSLTFENIHNELKPFIKKNEDLLKDVSREHLQFYRELKNK